MKFAAHSSWSKDRNTAKKFVNDPAYSIVKDNKSTKIKILISKTISKTSQILDIDGFVMFMGAEQLEMQGMDAMSLDSALKEKEVLVAKGVVIKVADITMI
jgi:hypothetical protein